MLIRHANVADLPRIVEIYNASIPGRRATADLTPISVDSRRDWFVSHDPNARPIWALETDDGDIAAWLSVRSFYGRPAYHATVEMAAYVAPEHQERGFGSALVAHLIEQAPTLGVRTVLSFIFSHNPASLRLVKKHGFEKWGLLPSVADMDGQSCDLEIWGRPIPTD